MPYSLEKDIEAAGETGFQGVEIWKSKLDDFLKNRRVEELRGLLSRYRLGAAAICAFSGYVWCTEEDFKKRVEQTKPYFQAANAIGCGSLIVCAEGAKDKTFDERVEAHATRLARLAETGREYGVRIAMEWFWNLREAFAVVERANHDHLGLVIDTFHWYRGDGEIENIDLTPRGKLFVVHVNDCENLPREKLTDKNRLYCGLGVIPLVEILDKLKRLGYDGYLSVELFRDEYWKRDPKTINRESMMTLREVMSKASVL